MKGTHQEHVTGEKMGINRDTEVWRSIYRMNKDVLNSIATRQGDVYGATEVVFRSQFQNKDAAMEARKLLRDLFVPSKTTHLYTMNNEDGFECILSIVIPITAESITDVETAMIEICKPIGGEDITWEYESNKPTQH